MEQFLKIVARGYSKEYNRLSQLTFVMPNKRSGTFLLKEFADQTGKSRLGPRILSIEEFIESECEEVIDSRLDLLFRLYNCYLQLEGADKELSFERFYSWGETILSDFNEIDLQMVNADGIFKNVVDLNSIKSNFLTDSQKRVMVEYFGISQDSITTDTKTLWADTGKDDTGGGAKKRYLALWKLLAPLYHKYKEELKASGLTTGGGAYRSVAERIEQGYEPFPGEKLIFVGFNALSESEYRIFSSLQQSEFEIDGRKEAKADFVWDMLAPAFEMKESPAGKFVDVNNQHFPMPGWIKETLRRRDRMEAPKITVIGVPSNVMQAKIIGQELNKVPEDIAANKDKSARIAVVVPDENLLMPILYSLPSKFSTANLTMGFPLKQTSVIGFASLLRRLHQDSKESGGKTVYFFDDVRNLLSHPYSHLLFEREEINKFLRKYEMERKLVVSRIRLMDLGEAAKELFAVIPKNGRAQEVIRYLLSVFHLIAKKIEEKAETNFLRSEVELTCISTYIDSLMQLQASIEEYNIQLSEVGVFMLADRLIAGETVHFKGEPLEGLQVMGVLETRCLDFEEILMPSVNDKILPKVGRNSTFLPNMLRTVFEMPPANYQEEIFAYYFFRLLGRTRKAIFTYDSRSAENRNPEPSRYLLQLKYLYPDIDIEEIETKFNMPFSKKGVLELRKEGELLEGLKKFTHDKSGSKEKIRNFSASALRNYFQCDLKFVFNDVMRLYIEKEKLETIEAADLGSIVHKVVERLYFPGGKSGRMLRTPILMTAEEIERLQNLRTNTGESLIESEARKAIMEIHFGQEGEEAENGKLRGSARIIHEYIVTYINYILDADKKIAPFRLWGAEIERSLDYRLPDGRTVHFKMVIDRLDQGGDKDLKAPFRIVDYKTGSVHLDADGFDDIFDGSTGAQNIFQLFFYAELLLLSVREGAVKLPPGISYEEFEENLQLTIYDVVNLPKGKGMKTPKIGRTIDAKGKPHINYIGDMGKLRRLETEKSERIWERIISTIEQILDEKEIFLSTEKEERCRICDYRLRCELMRKEVKKE